MTQEGPRRKTKAKRTEERAVKLALLIGLGILLGIVVTLLVFEWLVTPDSPLAYAVAYAFLFLCALFFVVGAALVGIIYYRRYTPAQFDDLQGQSQKERRLRGLQDARGHLLSQMKEEMQQAEQTRRTAQELRREGKQASANHRGVGARGSAFEG